MTPRRARIVLLAALLSLLSACSNGGGSSGNHSFAVATVATGLSHPWALAFLPDGEVLVSERSGDLRVIRNGQLQPQRIPGVPGVRAVGHGGLLDLAVHPNFINNRLLYFSYAAGTSGALTTRVARGRYQGGVLSEVQVIFEASPAYASDQHFGSRLAFGRDGTLYVSIGDRMHRADAQELGNHIGKIVRLRDDGGIPANNPFISVPGARSEIFSFGHRNPQGLAIHPTTGELWSTEHGPSGGDEVNIIRAGRNYGWPVISYGSDYDGSPIGVGTAAPGMEQPVIFWRHSIAPAGMTFYTGSRFPGWRGDLFFGTLSGRDLYRLVLSGNRVVRQERLLTALELRIRDVEQGPDGMLWLVTDHDPGQVLRLEPVD